MRIILLFFLSISFIISVCAQKEEVPFFREKFRPQYHLTTPKGNLFDPTGLVYVSGHYHLNRRLAVSSDLVHWKLENIQRLNTDSTREMSGSVVIDSNNSSGFGKNRKPPLVAIYSSLRKKDGLQTQCIAYSNDEGKTWSNFAKNPVIDIGSTEFRDPQVFWHHPTQKWVMVVAMAAEQKIRFYNSDNLKTWTYLSDFGPEGAVRGVWECPDIFELSVDGNVSKKKWVLSLSVQPIGGQYFIGNFDGKKFVVDALFLNWVEGLKKSEPKASGTVLFDFENGLKDWKKEGEAFNASPASGSLPYQNAVIGYVGKKLINSFYNRDEAVGKLTSPSFIINKPFLNFLIGGGDHPGKTCINLVVDNKVVHTKTGVNTEILYWASWNVAKMIGRKARLEIVDAETGGFGHISIDHVMLSDKPAKNSREQTSWVDYGPDFYAVRSWVNLPAGRRVWLAWMGSWLYANSVPTNPWKGGHTFPRELRLKTFPEGIRLVQEPVDEIQSLRKEKTNLQSIRINEGHVFDSFKIKDNSYELEMEVEVNNQSSFGIDLCKGQRQTVTLSYNAKQQRLTLDRSLSGETSFSVSFPHSYTAPVKIRGGKIMLHILVDHSSVEVFANKGEATITCQIFPDPLNKGLSIYTKNGYIKLNFLNLWQLKSIWNEVDN